ncbi:MAG: hypothetical protein WD715_16970 [Dongiaceae bacterium]
MTSKFALVAWPVSRFAGPFAASGNAPESVLRPVIKPALGKAILHCSCGSEAAPNLLESSTRTVQGPTRDRLRGASLFGMIKNRGDEDWK